MRDHWGNPIGEPSPLKPLTELTQPELQTLIADAVFRGALKALATVLLVSALIGLLVELLRNA